MDQRMPVWDVVRPQLGRVLHEFFAGLFKVMALMKSLAIVGNKRHRDPHYDVH
jgi:hypothetical protein